MPKPYHSLNFRFSMTIGLKTVLIGCFISLTIIGWSWSSKPIEALVTINISATQARYFYGQVIPMLWGRAVSLPFSPPWPNSQHSPVPNSDQLKGSDGILESVKYLLWGWTLISVIQGRAVDPRTPEQFWGWSLNPRTVLGLDFVLGLRTKFGGCLPECIEGTTFHSLICFL